MHSELGEVVLASTMKDGERELRVEIADPRQENATHGWQCTYRVEGARAHHAHGTDRLAAIYAALIGARSSAARVGSPGSDRRRSPVDTRLVTADSAGSVAKAREFGLPLGARAVHTASGPVVIVLGRPRQDPNRPQTYLCPFRIDDRTEVFAQGIDAVHAVLSAIRGVGAILGIARDWPKPSIPRRSVATGSPDPAKALVAKQSFGEETVVVDAPLVPRRT